MWFHFLFFSPPIQYVRIIFKCEKQVHINVFIIITCIIKTEIEIWWHLSRAQNVIHCIRKQQCPRIWPISFNKASCFNNNVALRHKSVCLSQGPWCKRCISTHIFTTQTSCEALKWSELVPWFGWNGISRLFPVALFLCTWRRAMWLTERYILNCRENSVCWFNVDESSCVPRCVYICCIHATLKPLN